MRQARGEGVEVSVGVWVGLRVRVGRDVRVGRGVPVAVGVALAVAVAVGLGFDVGVAVLVAVGAGDAVIVAGLSGSPDSALGSVETAATSTARIKPPSPKSLLASAVVVGANGAIVDICQVLLNIAKATAPRKIAAIINAGIRNLLEGLPLWTSRVSMIARIINIDIAPT